MYNNYSFCSCLFWNKVGHSMEESHTSWGYLPVQQSRHRPAPGDPDVSCPRHVYWPLPPPTTVSCTNQKPELSAMEKTQKSMVFNKLDKKWSAVWSTEPIISVPNRTNHLITVSVKVCAAHVVETTVCLLLSEWLTC